jgi:hypothetical protein
MKKSLSVVIAVVLLLSSGFYAGYRFRDKAQTSQLELEDYALSNILGELAYAWHLREGKHDELRQLIDVSLNGHLSRLREYGGTSTDAQFSIARLRTLGRVADLWASNPPFRTDDFEQSKVQEWYPEWERSFRANLDLITTAKAECARVRCYSAQPGAAGDAPPAEHP